MDLVIEICASFALVVWAVVIIKVVWQAFGHPFKRQSKRPPPRHGVPPMAAIYRNRRFEFFFDESLIQRAAAPFIIATMIKSIQDLRDWANDCVRRDLLERQSITISAPVVTTYKIGSHNSSKVYTLTERLNHWTCNCPAMHFYSNRGYCKHIKQVKNASTN